MEQGRPADGVVPCQWCSEIHPEKMCPRVKAIEFDIRGEVTRVEYFSPAERGLRAEPPESEPIADYPKLTPKVA